MRKKRPRAPERWPRRVALYLRRSTNQELQADSLEIQEEILRAYAAKLGYEVVAVFSESASGRDAGGRSEFTRLIEIVVSGAADFDAILVRDVSRWGRFDNIDESAYYDFLCFRHHVQVVYVEESFGSDHTPYAALQKSMKRVLAAEFSREKSRIITHGKTRSASRGFHSGGPPPYGMKRVLVEPDGRLVQDLPRGRRKAVSCQKTKLAPARDETSATVTRIFESFVERCKRPATIARELNDDGLMSPGGSVWTVGTIVDMLGNARYAGIGTLRTPDEEIAVEDAYEPLIPREIFERARIRLIERRRADLTTQARLIREARAAHDRWGDLPASLLREMTRIGLKDMTQARLVESVLDDVFAAPIADAKHHVAQALSRSFTVENHGAYLVLDGRMSVGFTIGWRRVDLVRAPVVFFFLGTEPHDFMICFGCQAEPEFAVVTRCLAEGEKIRAGGPRRILRSIATTKRSPAMIGVRSDASLVRWLRRAMWTLPHLAQAAVRDVAQAAETVTFKGMGRQLKWPPTAARRVYYQLREAGEALPELRSEVARRKVRVPPKPRGRNMLLAICPECGAQRYVWPCIAKVMKGGLSALCHECSLAKGRATTLRKNHGSRTARRAKYEFLHEIALMLLRVMRTRKEYERATAWAIATRRFATLRWKSRSDGTYHRLSLDCTEDFMERCHAAVRDKKLPLLADAILDRTTWTGGHADKKTAHVWFRRLE